MAGTLISSYVGLPLATALFSPFSIFGRGRSLAAFLTELLGRVNHPAARALVRPRGLRGTGPGGAWVASDHRRALVAGVLAAVVAFLMAMRLFDLAERRWLRTSAGTVATGVGLFLFVASLIAAAWGLRHLRGAIRRPVQ